jgi:hypothetical protein
VDFNLMNASLDLFLHPQIEPAPDPHRTGFERGFHFLLTGVPENQKKPRKELEQNLKKPKT